MDKMILGSNMMAVGNWMQGSPQGGLSGALQRNVHMRVAMHMQHLEHQNMMQRMDLQHQQNLQLEGERSAGTREAANAHHNLAMQHFSQNLPHLEPGTAFNMTHGDISISGTKAKPAPTPIKPLPVKKNRGGKK